MSRKPYRSCDKCTAGYCAPLRCYCGHKECNAYASYIDLQAIPRVIDGKLAPAVNAQADTWANREEDTWLDKL